MPSAKRHVILTASDGKYGDFLIEHWLRSLRENVDLTGIDVAVADYGLSVAQKYYLEGNRVTVLPCVRDGHPAVVRYRDFGAFLRERPYDQALFTDGGDMVFQADIAPLFRTDTDSFRAVCEDSKPAFSLFVTNEFFSRKDKRAVRECFVENRMINAGFLLGPRRKMAALCRACETMILVKDRFGPDQLVVNRVLHRDGFVELPKTWNFVVATAKEAVEIDAGVFRLEDGTVIAVVHNAGNMSFLRPIEEFGYGPDRNRLKQDLYVALRTLYRSTEGLFRTQERFLESRRTFRLMIHKLRAELEKLRPEA